MAGLGMLSWWRVVHAGAAAPEAAVYAQRSASVGAGVRNARGATILVVRDAEGPQVFLAVPSSPQAPMLAGSLAAAVGGKHVPCTDPPVVNVAEPVGRLVAVPADFAARVTQSGRDPSEVARFVAANMPVGCWLAVSLRPPAGRELRAARRWFRHRLAGAATHYSLAGEALLASFLVGGLDTEESGAFLTGLAAMLPGFDLESQVERLPGRAGALAGGGVVAALGSVAVWLATSDPVLAVVGAVPGAVWVGAVARGLVPSVRDRTARILASGGFPSPGSRPAWRVRKPRRETEERKADPGSYPLAPGVFLVGPEQVAAIACPHFGSIAGASASRRVAVPAPLRAPIGPLVGWAGDGEEKVGVHLSAADMWAGVMVSGVAGSGKTVAVDNLFAFDSLERVCPSGRPGWPASRNALVVFESKGADGVRGYGDWTRVWGDTVLLVDLADPATPAVSLLPDGGDPEERAAVFVSAMVYAFGEQAIAYRSQNTLRPVIAAALLCDDRDAAGAGLPAGLSFVEFADVLLGGRGEPAGQALFAALVARVAATAPGEDRAVAERVVSRLEPLYGPKVTPAARRTLVEAPQSKIALLASVASWWRPSRPRVSFEHVLEESWAVIINTGSPLRGGAMVDDTVTAHVSAMTLYMLRRAIWQTCTGWRAAGRSVTVFSDELSLLARHSPEVITWLRNQGRSFGVRLVFATQYPEQLLAEVRAAVASFGTRIWFQQNARSVIDEAVADLTKDGSEWRPADLAGLERYSAIVAATVEGRPQPAVVVRMGFWDGDRRQFVADQGAGRA